MSHISTPSANAIRILAVDAVQKANSGHPGAPMGMADIATVLYKDHLRSFTLIWTVSMPKLK